MSDEQRLDILRKAAEAAPEAGNVVVATRDLRWLVELAAGQAAAAGPTFAPAEAAGDVLGDTLIEDELSDE